MLGGTGRIMPGGSGRNREDGVGRSREEQGGRRQEEQGGQLRDDGAGRRVPGVSFPFILTCPDPEVHVLVEWTMLVRNQGCKVPYYNQAWGSSYLIVWGWGFVHVLVPMCLEARRHSQVTFLRCHPLCF